MIYLINPKEDFLENAGDRVPIGLLSISANLKKKGHHVKVFDLNHTPVSDLFNDLKKDKPKHVGISVYTSPTYKYSVNLAQDILSELPRTNMIAGGYHATAMPESLRGYFDAVILGEAENTFEQAMNKGGIYQQDIPNLDDLQNPDRKALDMSKYGMNQSGKRATTLITSRGCPYNCAFCFNYTHKTRFEPIDKVITQISQVKKEGFESIYFLDDVFTLKEDRMTEIVEYCKMLDLPFRVTTRANLVNESKLETLAKNGCEWLSLGIESGNDRILNLSNKGMTTKDNYNAVKTAGQKGIKTKGFFILGLPGETKQTAKQTISFARKLSQVGLSEADFYYLTPFPGTPIWRNPEKFGIEIVDKDYTKYSQVGKKSKCVINTEYLKAEEIEELVLEAKQTWKK